MRTTVKPARGRRWRTWTVGVVAVVVTLVGGWAPPASAAPLVLLPGDVDDFKLVSQGVDFGGGTRLNLGGRPSDWGHLFWMYDFYNPDVVWPLLTGSLFINNAAGLCARVGIDYHDRANDTLTTWYGGTVCAPTNQLIVGRVHLMPYGSDDIDHVHVLLQTVASNGSVITLGSMRHDP